MRNLKKILALVLALVMSLSLMATASAADFKDASDISDNYQTAVSVLSQLEVFKGYAEDGTFRPQGEITRAEVATIIYRIATGDAKDAQASIYTNMTTSFTDLDKAEWARGYVNYCHNAQIIKGESATKFNPNGKITGYATLAMILRAMGYGRNGEFEGSQWEINTAAKAKEIGIIDNVMEAQLGSNAPRELVAEILFRALLTEMVDYTVLNGYVKNGKTLGYEHFKLEELEGVIVANEFANLYGTSVLANGKTKLEVAADDIRDLAVTTEITDIGMRQHVYITGSTVLDMDDTDLNNVTETGAATDISTASKFSATAEMSQGSGTEFYTNFGRSGYNSSDYRIEYEMSVLLTDTQLKAYTEDIARVGSAYAWFTKIGSNVKLALADVKANDGAYYSYVYHRVIPVCAASVLAKTPASQITPFDMDNIQSIFYRSNGRGWYNDNDQTTNSTYVGRVYVATQTSKDISDEISYNEFVDKYINELSYEINWGGSSNGAWVKFIDNDLDGVCDYAFKTVYTMDKAMGTYTKGDKTYTEYNKFNEETGNVRYMGDYTPAVGDVVLAATIDGQILVEKANDVTKTVNNYNWRDDKITTTDGDEYGQSGNDVTNNTSMQEKISTMADKTEYIMYFDHFGYVRAYELPGGTQYALLTEIYAQNNATGSVLQNWPMTVELSMPNEDGKAVTGEYALGNGSTAEFVAKNVAWTEVYGIVSTGRYYNWLQPAIAHLGVTRAGLGPVRATPTFTGGDYSFWSGWKQYVKGGIVPGVTADKLVSQEFNYGTQYIGSNNAKQDNTVSFTNVAAVNINDKTATVKGAAQLKLDRNGNPDYFDINGNGQFDAGIDQYRYSVDYVQLTRDNVVAKQTMYPVNNNYGYSGNKFVNATHDTEYYIVHNNGVEYFKDYVNMPKLNADNYIHAAYAVARDTSFDSAKEPYWVADVIVYEVRDYTDLTKTNISLAYFNQSRTSDQVQLLKTLTNAKNGPEADLTPAVWDTSTLTWGADRGSFGDYAGYGFYQLWNATEVTDGAMTARKIEMITKDFNKNGIYAGYVDRVVENGPNGGYLTINVYDASTDAATPGYTPYSVSVTDNVYTITTDTQLGGGTYNEANKIRYTNLGSNQVHTGDLVIWQGGEPTAANWVNSAYIVDLGNPNRIDTNWGIFTSTASFLLDYEFNPPASIARADIVGYATPAANSSGLWQKIVWEQKQATSSTTYNVVVERELADGTKKFDTITLANGVVNGGTTTFNLMTNVVTPAGYAPIDITSDVGAITADGTDIGGTGVNTVTSTATSSAKAHVACDPITSASLTVTNGNANVKVVIKYKAVGYTVTGGTSVSVLAPATVINSVTANGTKVIDNVPTPGTTGTLSGLNVGKSVRFQVNLSAPVNPTTHEVILEVTKSSAPTKTILTASTTDGGINFYVDYTMPAEPVTVNVSIQKLAKNITATGDAGVTNITATGADMSAYADSKTTGTTRWAPSSDIVFTVTVPATKMVATDTVTVTAGGVNVPYNSTNWDVAKTSATEYTVTLKYAGTCVDKDVAVIINTKDVAYNITAITLGTAATTTDTGTWNGSVSVGTNSNYQNENLAISATNVTGTPVTYTTKAAKDSTLYVCVTGTSTIAPNVSATGATVTGPVRSETNAWYYVLTNVTGDVEITVVSPVLPNP